MAPSVLLSKGNVLAPKYANAEWGFNVPFEHIQDVSNITLRDLGTTSTEAESGSTAISLQNGAQAGHIIVPFKIPFVIVSGSFHLRSTLHTAHQQVYVYLSKDGKSWSLVGYMRGPEYDPIDINLLGKVFHTYACYFRVVLENKERADAPAPVINELGFNLVTQCNPLTFPTINEGEKNVWDIEFAPIPSQDNRKPEIRFRLEDNE